MSKHVSRQTRSAQKVTKLWQESVCNDLIKSEVQVSNNSNEKIDVVDTQGKAAYELKVSGKNSHHEFFKDLFKIITFNLHNNQNPIEKFYFITEESGRKNILNRLDEKFVLMISDKHKLIIEVISIAQE